MPDDVFDFAVIGAGPAGHEAALAAADAGMKTVLIDRSESSTGGTCLNEGCIPVKSWLHFSETINPVLSPEQKNSLFQEWQTRRREDQNKLRTGILSLLKNKKITLIYGQAQFGPGRKITVKNPEGSIKTVIADKILLACGSEIRYPVGLEADGKIILNSTQILDISCLPASITVIGGGAIGCEFATFFTRLGVRTTLIEVKDQLLPGEDAEAARTLARELKKTGADVRTETTCRILKKDEKSVTLLLSGPDGEEELETSLVLTAAGRKPSLDFISPEQNGIETERGCIRVNEHYETSVPGVYAAGDLIATAPYAHAAAREGVAAALCAAGLDKHPLARVSYNFMPNIVFSEPQVASAGLRERDIPAGSPVKILKRFFRSNGKSVLSGHDSGLVKVFLDTETGLVKGAVMAGHSATELLPVLVVMMEQKITVQSWSAMTFGHPTVAEILQDIFRDYLLEKLHKDRQKNETGNN